VLKRLKLVPFMSDPIDWHRRIQPGHQTLWNSVRELIKLRKSHLALKRNETNFFYFHPSIDENFGGRVFAFCRTADKPLGNSGQIVVIANTSHINYQSFELPWFWNSNTNVLEIAPPAHSTATNFTARDGWASFSLAPFQVRVFSVI